MNLTVYFTCFQTGPIEEEETEVQTVTAESLAPNKKKMNKLCDARSLKLNYRKGTTTEVPNIQSDFVWLSAQILPG